MSTPAAAAYHVRRIAELSALNDWASLCRHWLAHQHYPALSEAIGVARRLAAGGETTGEALVAFLSSVQENPFYPKRQPADELLERCSRDEQASLYLLVQYPRVALCEMAARAAVEHRGGLLKIGLEAAGQAIQVSQLLGDLASEALFQVVLASGFQKAHQLEAARQHFDEALRQYRQLECDQTGVFLAKVAATLNNLGTVLSDLRQLEAAQQSYDEALRIRRQLEREQPGVFLADVAMTLNNLGNVLSDLRQLEPARQHFDEALQHYRLLECDQPGVFLAKVAATLNNLGNVLSNLQQLEAARQHYDEALRQYRQLERDQPGVFLDKVAMTLNNLGNVLLDLRQLEAAREHYDEALRIRRQMERDQPGVFLADVAATLNNLGNVLSNLRQLEPARQHYDEALRHYRQLERDQPGLFLPNMAATLNNLGAVLSDLRQLEAARQHYDEALQLLRQAAVLNPAHALFEQQRCLRNLAILYLEDAPELGWPDRHKARDALRQALHFAEEYRGMFRTPAQRQRAQGESLETYERLVRLCVDLWDVYRDLDALREAVQVAEASRARNLIEMLAEETLEPANTPPDLIATFRALRRQLRDAQFLLADEESRPVDPEPPADSDSEPGTKSSTPLRRDLDLLRSLERLPQSKERIAFLRQQVNRLKEQHTEQLQRIHRHDADFDPDRPVAGIDFATAQRLVPDDVPSAVVQYTLTDKRGFALVLTRDNVELVPLPQLSHPEAVDLARQWFNAYYNDRPNFDDAIPKLLEPVGVRAVQPLVDHLAGRGIQRIILSPNRALHLFPLHACRLANGRYLADEFEVVYTPSLSILHRCARRPCPKRDELLLVENPTSDLPFTAVEGHQLRKRYPTPHHLRLHGSRAQRAAILQSAGGRHVLNYTGHAYFNPAEPLRSALILGLKDDEQQWLTLRDVFCALHLPDTQLTVINGCESAMLLPDRLDELVMLPTGFLYAGSAAVLCTLWRVYDLSSALLVDRFHQEWHGGLQIGAALREAQRWLREDIPDGVYLQRELLPKLLDGLNVEDVRRKCEEQAAYYAEKCPDRPPFASPAHWAAMTASGLTYPLTPAVPAD